ncbi:uncharacterized protein DEA37_0013237, partial [Paragonimus westermani]
MSVLFARPYRGMSCVQVLFLLRFLCGSASRRISIDGTLCRDHWFGAVAVGNQGCLHRLSNSVECGRHTNTRANGTVSRRRSYCCWWMCYRSCDATVVQYHCKCQLPDSSTPG